MNDKKISLWERLLFEEIGVEFKACLYFFCILFYYSIYKVLGGSFEANIIHMLEMILMTYVMSYVQLYLLSNFDEGDYIRVRETVYIILCSAVYTGVSYLLSWFDGNIYATAGYFLFMVLAYICGFIVYKFRRNIDARLLNEDLKLFKERQANHE